jgi:plasmid stabilization system protein ParE
MRQLRITAAAQADLERMFEFLADNDFDAAVRARAAIEKAYQLVREFPFACRKADPHDAFLREIVVPFGSTGYVALFEIDSESTVTILAVRHQREDDFY